MPVRFDSSCFCGEFLFQLVPLNLKGGNSLLDFSLPCSERLARFGHRGLVRGDSRFELRFPRRDRLVCLSKSPLQVRFKLTGNAVR